MCYPISIGPGSRASSYLVKYYFGKLISPRPSFPHDITPAEAQLMKEHQVYWRNFMDQGYVVVFGPVADPKGFFGILVLELPDDLDARALMMDDPVLRANIGFGFELYPMPSAVLRDRR